MLRRSKFTRQMSLCWRLCRTQPAGMQLDTQAWKQFTPTEVNPERCYARTWNAGRGGQCSRAKCGDGSPFCRVHAAGEKWKTHGRVDGQIPARKLCEFMRVAKGSGDKERPKACKGNGQ